MNIMWLNNSNNITLTPWQVLEYLSLTLCLYVCMHGQQCACMGVHTHLETSGQVPVMISQSLSTSGFEPASLTEPDLMFTSSASLAGQRKPGIHSHQLRGNRLASTQCCAGFFM